VKVAKKGTGSKVVAAWNEQTVVVEPDTFIGTPSPFPCSVQVAAGPFTVVGGPVIVATWKKAALDMAVTSTTEAIGKLEE